MFNKNWTKAANPLINIEQKGFVKVLVQKLSLKILKI